MTNGYAYDASTNSVHSGESIIDDCETFLESYSRGDIEVGGPEPPESAKSSIPPDILSSGDLFAPNPPDDDERARELYQFRILTELNHDKKLGLDRFARLASLICDAKICMITFLDDKTHYISHELSPEPWLSHVPMGRSAGMCPHTILKRTGEVFEVPDTREDWRFRGKPFVTGHPYLRFYAGVPLRTKSNFNIGTLCVVDFSPKRLSESQTSALKDLAKMIMNDLQLYRDRELNEFKSRMANSITQFTRGIIRDETKLRVVEKQQRGFPEQKIDDRGKGWRKRKNSADKDRHPDPSAGIMGFYDLGNIQAKEDVSTSGMGGEDKYNLGNERATDDSLGVETEDVDVKEMYRYACRLMRETLDVEGVCFVDIEGLGEKTYLDTHDFLDEGFTHVDPTSSLLGYSHSTNFGETQIKNWSPLAQWNHETENSNLNRPNSNTSGNYHRKTSDAHDSDSSANHADAGRFSNQFLTEFLSTESSGEIYNNGIPVDIQNFLPRGVEIAILVPIYGFDQQPFTLICAYSTDKYRRFLSEEKQYLMDFGSQVLSQVLKKRVILADRAKGIFISNISHELRSPLHGILASAEFLLDTRLDVLQRTFIDTVNSCGRTLLEVINHVLDFGKLMYVARLENTITRPQVQRSTSNTSSIADTLGQRQSDSTADLAVIVEQVVEACYAGYEYKEFFGQVDIGAILGEPQLKNTDSRHGMVPDFGRKDASCGLTVVIDVDQRSDGWAFALQSGAVQRIVMNLTGNALKYTSAGWVRIQLSAKEVEGRTTVQITVSDSGKGISPEFLRSRLFSPFSQEDTLQAGTGLGMSIVKQVVERLGGNISVSSQLGIGTQVRVTLPGQAITDKAELEDNVCRLSTRTKGMKVFLTGFDTHVTAGRLTCQSIERYLTTWYDMEVVDDLGSSDLIISDDCPELHHYFQQSHNSSLKFDSSSDPVSETPIPNAYQASQPLIVLCSNALRYEYFGQQSDSTRVINFVSKPCGPHKLATGIAYCLEQSDSRKNNNESGETAPKDSSNTDTAPQTVATSGDDTMRHSPLYSSGAMPQDDLSQQQLKPSRSPSILIVEDNAVNSLILATFLRKKGYSFEQAENGLLAVQTVEANPKGFDVILMDIQMPVMDGSEATAAIRNIEKSRPDIRPAYIVALTGLATHMGKNLAFESGIDGFLTKPVSLRELVGVINDWERKNNIDLRES